MTKHLTLFAAGVLCYGAVAGQAFREVDDDTFVAGGDYLLSADTIYSFTGLTYVEEGATLTIEAGTVLWFAAGQAENASALIIARGAQIFANGTAEAPIIMTYNGDDVSNSEDIDDPITRGSWGGLIVLGRSTVALNDAEEGFGGGFGQIEGIDPNEPRARFGVDSGDPILDDDSGVLRYVSVRHAGSVLGSADEINGITLGGVGSGTEIDYVEVFANLDDGIELFGGTVDIKHALITYCGDDSYDYDLGYRGRGQYWVSVSGTDQAGRAAEWDGAIPDDNTPFAQVTLANATFIGPGNEAIDGIEGDGADFAFVIRDGAGARVYNSVVTNFPDLAVEVEDLPSDAGVDSYQRLTEGEVDFAGNVFGDFGAEDAGAATLIGLFEDGDDPTGATTAGELVDGNTFAADASLLTSLESGGLDPRPAGDGALADFNGLAELPDDDFFDDVDYVGAFAPDSAGVWIAGWTAFDHYGFLADALDFTSVRESAVASNSLALAPNPTAEGATLTFELERPARVRVGLFDATGRLVREDAAPLASGVHRSFVGTEQLPAGTYVVRVVADGGVASEVLVVR